MSASKVTVRGLDLDQDMEAWTAIHNQRPIAIDTLQIPYTSPAEWRTRIESSDTITAGRFLVAEIDGQVVGCAGFQLHRGRRRHVGTLGMSVSVDYHGQGVGSALMEAIIDLADNWYNLQRIELEVYVDNPAAVALYRKFGFDVEGTHVAYAYRDGEFADAYAMARLRTHEPDGGID